MTQDGIAEYFTFLQIDCKYKINRKYLRIPKYDVDKHYDTQKNV